jgi:excisionase family DNA binding protein
MNERRFLTVRQAGELYGLHPKTVRALCRARKLAHVRIPSVNGGRGQIRIDRIAVDRMLEEREVVPVTEQARIDRRKT